MATLRLRRPASRESAPPKQQSLRKRVCFVTHVMICPTLNRKDFSEEEKTVSWYNREELACLKQKLHEEVRAATLAGSGCLLRALCHKSIDDQNQHELLMMVKNLSKQIQNRRNGRQAVLGLQSIQREHMVQDAHSIAQVYSAATKHCVEAAHMAALAQQAILWKETLPSVIFNTKLTQGVQLRQAGRNLRTIRKRTAQ